MSPPAAQAAHHSATRTRDPTAARPPAPRSALASLRHGAAPGRPPPPAPHLHSRTEPRVLARPCRPRHWRGRSSRAAPAARGTLFPQPRRRGWYAQHGRRHSALAPLLTRRRRPLCAVAGHGSPTRRGPAGPNKLCQPRV